MVHTSTSYAVFNMKLALFCTFFFTLAANGIVFSTRLSPRILRVKENEVAKFSCRYSCSVVKSNSHTTLWVLGDMARPATFINSHRSRHRFNQRIDKGLTILNVVDRSNCNHGDGDVIHELSINVTIAARWNRTPLQCVAQATNRNQKSFYSAYAVLLVEPNSKSVPTTTAPPTPLPCPSPVTITKETTHTETITSYQVITLVKEVTETKEVTVTKEVAATPEAIHSTSSSSLGSSQQPQLPHPTNIPVIRNNSGLKE